MLLQVLHERRAASADIGIVAGDRACLLVDVARRVLEVPGAEPRDLLEALRTQTEISSYPAPGLGNDLRIRGSSLVGAALEVDDSVVHLCAFQLAAQSEAERRNGNHRSHMAGTELRRRYMNRRG